MKYNPTPTQKKYQKYAGEAVLTVGALVTLASLVVSPTNVITMLVGVIAMGVGQLMVSFSE